MLTMLAFFELMLTYTPELNFYPKILKLKNASIVSIMLA